jgi:signal transduction histidine kinase/ligand-binding sensor domain-containing protein
MARNSRNFVRSARRLLLCGLLVVGAAAQAVEPQDLPLSLMNHKTWTARDGAPQGVRALAQDRDGTLWVGTEGGLFNFDGRVFKPFRPPPGETNLPAGPVISLLVTRDGALWAGTYQGLARIDATRVALYAKMDDRPAGAVAFIAESSDGSIWGASRSMILRIERSGAAHIQPPPLPYDSNAVGGIFIDSSNTLWVGQGGKLHRRSLDQGTYATIDTAMDFIFGFTQTADGNLWITDVDTKTDKGRHRLFDRTGNTIAALPDSVLGFGMLALDDGSLILATQAEGLRRFRKEQIVGGTIVEAKSIGAGTTATRAAAEKYMRADGLSSDQSRALLRDADGSVWVGGRRGLDRFRPAQLTPFMPEFATSGWVVCANPQGEVWVASGHGLYKTTTNGAPKSIPGASGSYLFCANNGDTWVVDSDGIAYVHADQLKRLPPIPGVIPYGYTQVAPGPDDVLYATVHLAPAAAGLWKFKDGQWTKLPSTGVPGRPALVAYVDSHARLWLGHRNGVIALPLEDRVFSSGTPGLENVYALLESSHGMLAAGGNGLAVLRDTDFQLLTFAEPDHARGVGGVLESLDGDVWLNASRGIVHVRASELEAALKDPQHAMKSELVTEGEFVGPVDLVDRAVAARDASGNLWFATLTGVFHYDPRHIHPDTRPPFVSIRSMSADDHAIRSGTAIGPRPQTVVIQYLGVNLTTPDLVVYRYRLEGLESTWQEAGHRTDAIYTQLPPGTYTFHVMASNGDGRWTEAVSAQAFTVAPSFFQTTWFALLCAMAGLLLLFGLFALRLRVVARTIRARAEERADERIRIARELHDTLLQGIQGLLLNFHVAAQKIAPDDESKKVLERALSTADRIIIEGRNRVSSLRSEHLTEAELIGAIENVGRDLSLGENVQFRVKRSGTAATLHTHVADEVFHIAREALTNAFRHAQATRIDVDLDYGKRFFEMSCTDNGGGFDPQAQSSKPGHWGLTGMAERAVQLGGHLHCRSEPALGTRLAVTIPSYRAYRRGSRLMHYLQGLRTQRDTAGE